MLNVDPLPLAGLRVLTFEHFAAGPYGSAALAALGAEVIKIEDPKTGGDASRKVGPYLLNETDSLYFQTTNLNKKSVALDIKEPEGRAALHRLVKTADAVINNLRGDQPEKLGLDYASLCGINPAVVCLHISAYGRDNSRKTWPGYDYLMQAEAGLMSVTGEADGPPCRIGVSMIDHMTGAMGVIGLLSCIVKAQKTGRGSDVDVSLFDVALHQLSYLATWYLNEGAIAHRHPRNAHASLTPVQTCRTADGWIFVMCMSDKFWHALAECLGHAEWKTDRRFLTLADRLRNRELLTPLLDEAFGIRSTEEWLEVMAGRVPVAPVHDVAQAFANPFVHESQMIATVSTPERAELRVTAMPMKVNGKRLPVRACRALGADNHSLLGVDVKESAAPRAKSDGTRTRAEQTT